MAVEIVGRDVELEAVSRLLASVAPGRQALALSGEPGMGKTLLLREAIDRARDRAFRVLQAQGSETETGLTFVALHDLLSGIDEPRLGRLPPPQRRAMDIALRRLAPGDEGIDQGAVTIALLGILRDLAADGPVLIAVDDVQWVDRSSAAVLGSALRRLTVEPVRVVATRRHDTSTGAIDGATDVVTDVEPALGGNVETIELRPLPLGALHHLIRARLGLSLARPALVQLHAATGGNPYFALEFARSIRPGVTSLAALDEIVPPDLRSLLAGRLKALPEAAHRVVTAIAVASDATEATLCRALDLPGTELEAALEPAIGDGLVGRRGDRVQLAHPLLASVARAEAAPSARRDLHRRLAAVVGDPERAALHLAQATTGSNEGVAARLEEAAVTARARGATMAALELYDRSIGLADAAERDALARRRVRRAEARFIAGDTAQAHRELAELLPTIADDNMRLEAALLLATIIWFDGSSHDAAEMGEHALATTDDPAWRARIHSRLAWMWEDDVERATSHARKALELLDPETEPGLYAFALLNAAEGDLQRGRSADHAAIARGHELQQHPQLWEFSTLPANWAKWMDQFDRTRELTEQYLARSRESGDESSVAQMLGYLAEVECWTGNLELAEQYADQAVETAEQTEQAVYLSAGLARRGLVRAYRGDLQGAGADGERALDLAESTASPQLTALALGLLGFVDLTRGDVEAVAAGLERALRILDRIGDRTQPAFRFQADYAEALIGLGRGDEAEVMIERLRARGELGPVPWARLVAVRSGALLASARGQQNGALALADEALALARESPMPMEVGRTYLAAGQIRRRAGRRRLALEALEEAADRFERLGARQWVDRARADAARLGLQRSSGTELTPSELRIARLAASGMTNRAVADRLFISAKTVEANLARVYAKLDIRSRAELGRVIAALDADGGLAGPSP